MGKKKSGKGGKPGKGIRPSTELAVAMAFEDDAQSAVRNMMRAGKLKKKCCRSKPRCSTCPVMALENAKTMRSKVSKAA